MPEGQPLTGEELRERLGVPETKDVSLDELLAKIQGEKERLFGPIMETAAGYLEDAKAAGDKDLEQRFSEFLDHAKKQVADEKAKAEVLEKELKELVVDLVAKDWFKKGEKEMGAES